MAKSCDEKTMECSKKYLKVPLGATAGIVVYNTPWGRMAAFALRLISWFRQKRDVKFQEEIDRITLAKDVADLIANKLTWNSDQLDWFAFTDLEMVTKNKHVQINFWLWTKNDTEEHVLVDELTKVYDFINNDELTIHSNGSNLKPTHFSACDDIQCTGQTEYENDHSNISYFNIYLAVFMFIIRLSLFGQ